MHELKADAFQMKEWLLKGDFDNFATSMREGWASKKRLADNVSNRHIDTIMEAAFDAGAKAGKVSGAGGGGFVTFLVAPERRVELMRALARQEGCLMTCHITRHGTEGWRLF